MNIIPTTITKNENLSSFTFPKGTRFSIEIPENHSTGYSWTVAEFNADILHLDNEIFVPSYFDQNSIMVGGGGTLRFDFITLTSGQSTIKTQLTRGSIDTLAETFLITIIVT